MTPAGRESTALRRLAWLYGVQTSYLDARKQRVEAKPESLLAALQGLGAPIERLADAEAALNARRHEAWCWHLEPVHLAWDGAFNSVLLRLPRNEIPDRLEAEIALEGGGVRQAQIALSNASVSSKSNLDGRDYVALKVPMKTSLPAGYHRLTLRTKGRELHSLVIAAPSRAYAAPESRSWGFFLPLYALHSQRSWGIGDLTDLAALVQWSAKQGASFVGTLPLLAAFLDNPYAPSPYEPVSRLFWNEIYIDTEAAVTALAGSVGEDVVVPAATVRAARDLNAREAVPYREVMALKRRALTEFTRHKDQGPAANEAAATGADRPALEDYAAFRAALETLGPRWREWPSPQRSGTLTPSDYDPETVAYYAAAQRAAEAQMSHLESVARQNGVRLYLDLPVGVHPDGYDPWRHQHLFVEKVSVGAPPDLLATEGQNWGFQPLNPAAQRRDGYRYTRAYLRRHLQAAGLLRIDHAIGLHRLFWIPEGGTGHDGVFVRQPSEELYAILSLESHRARSVVVGEDLGLVPPEVTQGMARHGIGDMYVQTFALTGDEDEPLTPPNRDSIASFGTHDLAPFAAFWTDDDLALRQRIGVMTDESAADIRASRDAGKIALWRHLESRGLAGQGTVREAYLGATRLLAESQAQWATLSLEDTWGETRPQNVPGTIDSQHANWQRRARYPLEQFDSLGDITKAIGVMQHVRGDGKETQNDGKE